MLFRTFYETIKCNWRRIFLPPLAASLQRRGMCFERRGSRRGRSPRCIDENADRLVEAGLFSGEGLVVGLALGLARLGEDVDRVRPLVRDVEKIVPGVEEEGG